MATEVIHVNNPKNNVSLEDNNGTPLEITHSLVVVPQGVREIIAQNAELNGCTYDEEYTRYLEAMAGGL
jgi:hypothetical protein